MQTTLTKAEEKVITSRHIPEGYRLAQTVEPTTEVYYKDYEDWSGKGKTKYIALIFLGRAVKATKHVAFRHEEERQEYVDNMLSNYQKRQEEKVTRRKERASKLKSITKDNTVKVGDIFEHTTIYYSNRTTFVKVVEVSPSGKTAIVERYGISQVSGDWMNGEVTMGSKMGDEQYKLRVIPHPWGDEKYKDQKALKGRIGYGLETYYPWNNKPIWNNCD